MERNVLRDARLVAAASAAWTITSSVAAVVVGLATSSIALIAFGVVGFFDFASDLVLLAHFRALHLDRRAEHLERVVLLVVTVGLIATGVAAVIVSVAHLLDQAAADSSPASVVLAACSCAALSALAARKRAIGLRLPSAALRADGRLSAVGAALAGVTLVGLLATATFGWWWADPVAALVIGLGAVALGVAVRNDAVSG